MLSGFRTFGALLVSAFRGVTGYYGRNLLTVLALSLGVLGLVTVSSASITLQRVIEQRSLIAHGPSTTATVQFAPSTTTESARSLADSLATDFIDVAVLAANQAIVVHGPGAAVISDVTVTTEALRDIKPFPISSGHWLSLDSHLAPRLVVNEAASAAALQSGKSRWTVQTASGEPVAARLVGVVNDGQEQSRAYLSIGDAEAALAWAPGEEDALELLVSAPRLDVDNLRKLIRDRAVVDGNPVVNSVVKTDRMAELENELSSTRSIFAVVLGLSLLSTMLGIANIGFAATRQRALELSLRRALGARRSHLFLTMIFESQIVALVAWAVAVGLAVAAYPTMAGLFGVPPGVRLPPFPFEAAAVGLAVSSIASLVGSVAPAMKAAQSGMSYVMRT